MPSRASAIARPEVCSLPAFGISGLRFQVSDLFLRQLFAARRGYLSQTLSPSRDEGVAATGVLPSFQTIRV